MVKEIEYDAKLQKNKYTISNLKGRENGHCFLEHIHGRLFEVISGTTTKFQRD